ncbi:single-stranded DNA-binding protein [Granulicoccus phenolivorans]|uniref:single-stranded DNA-binding protein n=1 Tax=Granulicoccus phenolivorans TaxID=266854 RepID=UPI0004070FC7|nr:single-stranded DNA-binding protein [Granulicoccus phenolivorans]
MSNPRNTGTVIGRLTADPRVFENRDGSKKVSFTVAADQNYTNAAGERGTDFVPVEAFVRAEVRGTGPYGSIHRGDLVAVNFSVRQERFQRNGAEVFETKVRAHDITFLESRSVTQARVHERVRTAEAHNRELQERLPQPVPAGVDSEPILTGTIVTGTIFGQPGEGEYPPF